MNHAAFGEWLGFLLCCGFIFLGGFFAGRAYEGWRPK